MDGSLHFRPSSRPLGTLFGDDFDRPETVPEPEVIEPVFSAAELANAREAAWREGNAAGLQEAAASDAAATRRAIESAAAQFADVHDAAAAHAEQSADAIARLLLDSLAAAFPVLCACYGEAEVQAIARSVLPALTQEQVVTVRTNPLTARSLLREIGRLDPDFAARVQIIECDAMTPAQLEELTALATTIDAVVVLILPGGLDPAEAADLAVAFAAAGASLLVATRLDLARRLGGILAASAGARLALTEAGIGPDAADGLLPITPGWLAARLLALPRMEPRK